MGNLTKAFLMNSGGAKTVPSGVICMWAGTNATIPTGWTRVTTLDGRYVKQIPNNSTNPGTTGGSGSHDHPYGSHSDHSINSHTHTWSAGAVSLYWVSGYLYSGTYTQPYPDGHPVSQSSSNYSIGSGGPASYDAAAVEPLYLTVIFIQSDGTPVGIPNNALAFFNAAAPTGWAQYTTGNSRLIKGAATGGDGAGTGGTGNTHSHTSAAHAHTISHTHTCSLDVPSILPQKDAGSNTSGQPHTHSFTSDSYSDGTSGSSSESTANGDMTPPWIKSFLIQNTSGVVSLPSSIICLWQGTLASIPAKWKLCDGTGGTPNLSQSLYTMASDTSGNIGTAGGASTHTHSGNGHSHTNPGAAHTHNPTTSSSTTPGSSGYSYYGDDSSKYAPTSAHTHDGSSVSGSATPNGLNSRTTTATANSSNDPTYTTVAYIQYTG